MAINFEVGEKFVSLEDVEKKIADYSRTHYVDLYKRDSRSIDSAIKKKSISSDRVNAENKHKLKYYELSYACIHGGRKHKSCSKGIRGSATFRKGCLFRVSFRLTDDGRNLVVSSVTREHTNHEISEEDYQYYPKVRKLSTEQRAYAEDMLAMNANKKKLQHQLESDTGKSVLLKDLSNIANAARRRNNRTRNDLDECVNELRNVRGCAVDICTTQENDFCGLFIQDKKMRETFSPFPEILFLDATYKLLDLQFPVYVFACEDSNGATHIVGIGMLVTEDAPSVRWLIESFKKHNPEIAKTRLVMADKDINERDVIKEVLTHVKVLICLFHTLRTFKREINLEAMNINMGQKITCLEYITKMAYSKSELEYNSVRGLFLNVAPQSVKTYFEKNWHPIREEWVMGHKFTTGNFLNSTNNRLESLNGKLKQVITKFSSFENFINEFFIILSVLRNERSYEAAYSSQKEKVLPHSPHSAEAAYVKLLTSYASKFVLDQIKISNSVRYQWQDGQADTYTLHSSEGEIQVTHTNCSCCFFNSMLLPCRHIFSMRKKDGMPLFDQSLCDTRWTYTYFRLKSPSFRNKEKANDGTSVNDNHESSLQIDTLPSRSAKKMNCHQKFSIALNTCKQIANTISMFSDDNFHRKISQLKELNEIWTQNKEVGFQTFEAFSFTSPSIDNDENVDDATIDGGLISALTSSMTVDECSPLLGSETFKPDNEVQESEPELERETEYDQEVQSCLSSLIEKIVAQKSLETVDFSVEKFESLTVTKLDIKMPSAIKRKGRPKGSEKTTVIGLPARKKASAKAKATPTKFVDMSNAEREKLILTWCLGKEKANECLSKGEKITLADVDPTEIAPAIFNDLVCLKSIQYLFDKDAWEKLTLFYTEKMERFKYQCCSCLEVCLVPDDLISCDHCLKKYHYACGKCKKGTKKRHQWFCNQCKIKTKVSNTTTPDGQ